MHVLNSFLYIVGQLTLSSPLSTEQDIHVTVGVGDTSKITCSGDISEDGLAVTWNHPSLLLVSLHALHVSFLMLSFT